VNDALGLWPITTLTSKLKLSQIQECLLCVIPVLFISSAQQMSRASSTRHLAPPATLCLYRPPALVPRRTQPSPLALSYRPPWPTLAMDVSTALRPSSRAVLNLHPSRWATVHHGRPWRHPSGALMGSFSDKNITYRWRKESQGGVGVHACIRKQKWWHHPIATLIEIKKIYKSQIKHQN
jgi:hypothetical protein